jgi:hypothetical protein
MKRLLIFLLIACALTGCRTIKEVQREQSDYRHTSEVASVRERIDSIYLYQRDSIYIRERGDTVFIDRWSTSITYRDRLRTDTLRVTDSVRVEILRDIERIQGQSSWAAFERWCGRILLILLCLVSVYVIIKWKLKF